MTLTAAVNDGRRPSRGCFYLLALNKDFYAERSIFPLGHGSLCGTLMLLICDLQTLCFLFCSLLLLPSSLNPSLTSFFSTGCLSSSPSLSPLSPVSCYFFLSFLLSFLPSVPLLLWEYGRNAFTHTAKTH